jgi:hypothetical protein
VAPIHCIAPEGSPLIALAHQGVEVIGQVIAAIDQPINISHISIPLTSLAISSWIVKKIKIFYLIHMISILNSIFTIMF